MSSTEPKRYAPPLGKHSTRRVAMQEFQYGDYILFSDHQRIVSELDDQQFAVHKSNGHLRKRLRAALAGKANPQ